MQNYGIPMMATTVVGQSDSNGLFALIAFFAFLLAFGLFGGVIFWFTRRQKVPFENNRGMPSPFLVPLHQDADNLIEVKLLALLNRINALCEKQKKNDPPVVAPSAFPRIVPDIDPSKKMEEFLGDFGQFRQKMFTLQSHVKTLSEITSSSPRFPTDLFPEVSALYQESIKLEQRMELLKIDVEHFLPHNKK